VCWSPFRSVAGGIWSEDISLAINCVCSRNTLRIYWKMIIEKATDKSCDCGSSRGYFALDCVVFGTDLCDLR
jgi:hypothetical protein